jgi:protein phosphatase
MKINVSGLTDKGLARANNEDNLAIDEAIKLMVVCDGAGGQATGEVASKMAVEVIKGQMQVYAKGNYKLPSSEKNPKYGDITNCLMNSIKTANQAIYEAAKNYPQNMGMATTCVCAILGDNKVSYAHVGDSRLYIIREGIIQQLTSDHSLVNEQLKRGLITEEQAEAAAYKNILTRALGQDELEVDLAEIDGQPGDRLLLCSDGLTRMLNDDLIIETLKSEQDPGLACQKLVDLANSLGGMDNITVIIANLEQNGGAQRSILGGLFKGIKK